MTPSPSFLDRLQALSAGWLARGEAWLPQLLGALLLLVLGLVAASLAGALARQLLGALDTALARVLGAGRAARLNLSRHAAWVGRVVFWAVLLVFGAAAVQTLGLAALAHWLEPLFAQLPALLAGVLIIAAGVLLARLAAELVLGGGGSLSPPQRQVLARGAQATIVAGAVLVGADQMGLRLTFLAIFAGAVALALAGGAVVALSLGARAHVANLIGMQQLRARVQPGQRVRVAGYEGRVLQCQADALLIETADGRATLPGHLFSHEAVVQLPDPPADG